MYYKKGVEIVIGRNTCLVSFYVVLYKRAIILFCKLNIRYIDFIQKPAKLEPDL